MATIDYNVQVLLESIPSDRDIKCVGIEELVQHFTWEQLVQCIKHCRLLRSAFTQNKKYEYVGKHLFYNLGCVMMGCKIVATYKYNDNLWSM